VDHLRALRRRAGKQRDGLGGHPVAAPAVTLYALGVDGHHKIGVLVAEFDPAALNPGVGLLYLGTSGGSTLSFTSVLGPNHRTQPGYAPLCPADHAVTSDRCQQAEARGRPTAATSDVQPGLCLEAHVAEAVGRATQPNTSGRALGNACVQARDLDRE
jgi:hypothetical protein